MGEICVPTPLSRNREPKLAYVEATVRQVAPTLRLGQLIILESTTVTAEAVKITEHVFRAVNVALVNELKVIDAANRIAVVQISCGLP